MRKLWMVIVVYFLVIGCHLVAKASSKIKIIIIIIIQNLKCPSYGFKKITTDLYLINLQK